jgi:superfamily I DNA/RNA helicase
VQLIRLGGSRSVGTEPVELTLEQLTFILGPDGTGKTAFLHGRDAVRPMTVHKAKGLEFDVVVPAVEREMFWGDAQRQEHFVAVSRARKLLCLTVCEQRPRPLDAGWRWDVERTPQEEFLGYALSTQ